MRIAVLMVAKTYLGRGQARTNMYAVKGMSVSAGWGEMYKHLAEWVTKHIDKDSYDICEAMLKGGWYYGADDALFTYSVDEIDVEQGDLT